MKLTETGNLVLFDKNNVPVWQSFDYPTDALVLGQKLKVGQKLTPGKSPTNWTEQGLLSLSLTTIGLFAQTETNPPQVYYSVPIDFTNTSADSNGIELMKGTLALVKNSNTTGLVLPSFNSSVQYVKFESSGHLRSYRWDGKRWDRDDLFTPKDGGCGYPTVCGKYGICSPDEQCSCPTSSKRSYFKRIVDSDPKHGCVETVPLSCEDSQFQTFLELKGISYFTFGQDAPDLRDTNKESCREACAKDCSCSAAFFHHDSSCYLVSQVFSLANTSSSFSVAFIKVQNASNKSNAHKLILNAIVGSLCALIIFYVVIKFLVLRRQEVDEVEEDCIEQLPGLPTRFTYDDLIAITKDFSEKLGEGGFGSVYEGTLIDGTKVAVKCLDGLHQIKKSFLIEVEITSTIHHVNLVRLIGICAEKFCRLLVYEYMSMGSLDEWIFHKSKGSFVLDWEKRRKIIYDIAKGLNYLHGECRWKIIHMDIKPQNILLDENFNAKVADFGLSKLLDRDQSQAMTTMRGTPGYLAPEWLSATITEKIDVYSFGVVVLEIVCGRKAFDSSQNEEDMYLLGVFKRKAEEERLLDMVDNTSDDMQLNQPHVINMMKIATWCL
ncbi:hypothetical protein BT93_K1750 [Corymbia citriodora subsp. variegata]|nr:hypothetical protein BT93_K1750 [Corymbia citriodora subsp. variegata]